MKKRFPFAPVGRLAGAALVLLAAAAASVPVSAALVTSRAALAGNDAIDWGQLGPTGTVVPGTAPVLTAGLLAATVGNPSGPLYRFDEGDGTFAGNFAVGDRLISTFFTPGPIVIDFVTGLSRIGAQIMSNDYGPFTGTISVFDAANVLLESASFAGLSSNAADNSAIFLGIARATADIDRAEFSVTGAPNLDFAINQVDLFAGVAPTANVAEPSSVALLAVSLAGFAGTRRRRQAG